MKTILISSYACEPNSGSEPGIGWNWANELSKYYKVIVITRENNKEKIENNYKDNKNLKFFYCEVPKILRFWKKGQRGIHLYYWLWQKKCYSIAKKICKEYSPDYSMTLTFGNMWLPTYMDKLPCKFIWGPLGGGEGVPKELLKAVGFKQKILEIIRNINKIIPITNLRFKSICKNSHIIIVRTKDSLNCIPKKYKDKCITILETGISTDDIEKFKVILENNLDNEKKDINLVISGRMVQFKLFGLAVDSFSKLCDYYPNIKLNVIGDGPERSKLLKKVDDLHINNNVVFHGKLSRDEALKIMSNCNAVIISSAREGGSWILFESMLLKKPIVCFDTSGMSMTVDNTTGRIIPVMKYEKAIDVFAEKCKELLNNPELTLELGNNAYKKVINEFTWENRVKLLINKMEEEK
ncbi:MAG: glycosyltransferase [Clostridia bacterium]|nr:glycosyltransferase [Clostridia bacterium]